MIALQSPLKLDQCDGDTCVVLWLCDGCDDSYSFRVALSEIERALVAFGPTSHILPPEVPMEDFVEGTFTWAGRRFSLYFERSLGYMQFSSPSAPDVHALFSALSPAVTCPKA